MTRPATPVQTPGERDMSEAELACRAQIAEFLEQATERRLAARQRKEATASSETHAAAS